MVYLDLKPETIEKAREAGSLKNWGAHLMTRRRRKEKGKDGEELREPELFGARGRAKQKRT